MSAPDLSERALTAYHEAYHSVWRPGGDAGDHDEAHREGIAAVLALKIQPEEEQT